MLSTFIFFILLFLLLPIAFSWIIFEKAGYYGWSALVPFHRNVRILEIAGRPGWWIFLYIVPILNVIVYISMLIGLSKKFGHGVGFALGLLFCPYIFFALLAFGNSKYID